MDVVTRLFAKQNLHEVPASRINELPQDERTAALQDLHGASDMVEETNELIICKLQELDSEVLQIQKSEREALDIAMTQNPKYVQGLKLRFLRAERFQPARAARRMVKHFEMKRTFFNGKKELLGRDIRISDFEKYFPEDLPALRAGHVQLLPQRDRSGRAIFFIHPLATGIAYYPMSSVCRIIFWLVSVVSNQGDDVQLKGFILIWWGCGVVGFRGRNEGRAAKVMQMIPSLSLRFNGFHVCYSDLRLKMVFDMLGRTIQRIGDMMRLQTHYGSDLECRYTLMTFGIPTKILPLQPDGTPHSVFHQRYLKEIARMEQESVQPSVPTCVAPLSSSANVFPLSPMGEGVAQPGSNEVIMGRGRRGTKSAGNIALKMMLEEYYHEYCNGSKFDKTIISHTIYRKMKERGYRFVECVTAGDPKDWAVISEETARLRIAQLLRNLRKSNKIGKKR